MSIDEGQGYHSDESHEGDPQGLRRVDNEGKVLGGLKGHPKGREGHDDRSVPSPHPSLDGDDDRHATHSEGNACHREWQVTRCLEGEERKIEVTELPHPYKDGQDEEASSVRHTADTHNPLPYMEDELRDVALTAIAQKPEKES